MPGGMNGDIRCNRRGELSAVSGCVVRPFGTGRTRTMRGVGADTVTVTPRITPRQGATACLTGRAQRGP